jgi:hypothetical protein
MKQLLTIILIGFVALSCIALLYIIKYKHYDNWHHSILDWH